MIAVTYRSSPVTERPTAVRMSLEAPGWAVVASAGSCGLGVAHFLTLGSPSIPVTVGLALPAVAAFVALVLWYRARVALKRTLSTLNEGASNEPTAGELQAEREERAERSATIGRWGVVLAVIAVYVGAYVLLGLYVPYGS